MIIWRPLLLALANRCRGGLITTTSGQLGRLFWALPFAVAVFSAAVPSSIDLKLGYFLLLLLVAFGGACLVAWGKYDTIPTAWNPPLLALQGLIFVGPTALAAALVSWKLAVALILVAPCIVPSYWLGWKIPSKIKGFEQGVPLGELLYGFIIGFAIFLTTVL